MNFWNFLENVWESPILLWLPAILSFAIVFWRALRGELRLAGKGGLIVGVFLTAILVSLFFALQMMLGLAGGKPANPIAVQVTLYALLGTCVLAYVGMLPALVYLLVWKPSRRQLKRQISDSDL